jgi:hypothetical protein
MGATASYGAQLQIGDGAMTEAFTTVAGVKDISGPQMTRDNVEVTAHDSPDGYKERVPTLKDGGQVTFELNWDPSDATHDLATGLGSLIDVDDPTHFRLVYPRLSKRWAFSGYVTAYGPIAAPVAGVHQAPVTIMVTGQPVLEATS